MSLHRHILDNRPLFTALVLNDDIEDEILDKCLYELESPVDKDSLYGRTMIKLAYTLYFYDNNQTVVDTETDVVEDFKKQLPYQWVQIINYFFEMFGSMSKRPTYSYFN